MTAQNPCLSGGAIEIFLEPVLPAPRVLVVGDTPIAAAVVALGAELGLDAVAVERGRARARGRRSRARRRGARAGRAPHAAPRRSRRACRTSASWPATSAAPACSPSCAPTASPSEHLERIDVPAGLDIGARTPAEIALSILATIVAVRRGKRAAAPDAARPAAPASAADATSPHARGRPDLRDDGRGRRGHAFGGARRRDGLLLLRGLRSEFQAQHEHAVAAE